MRGQRPRPESGLALRASVGIAVWAAFGVVSTALAGPALADDPVDPGHYGYHGTADEFPVGMCINITTNVSIDPEQLKNTIPVPCTAGAHDMRVVQHAATPQDCTPPVYDAIWTTDGVVLCVVRDY